MPKNGLGSALYSSRGEVTESRMLSNIRPTVVRVTDTMFLVIQSCTKTTTPASGVCI